MYYPIKRHDPSKGKTKFDSIDIERTEVCLPIKTSHF